MDLLLHMDNFNFKQGIESADDNLAIFSNNVENEDSQAEILHDNIKKIFVLNNSMSNLMLEGLEMGDLLIRPHIQALFIKCHSAPNTSEIYASENYTTNNPHIGFKIQQKGGMENEEMRGILCIKQSLIHGDTIGNTNIIDTSKQSNLDTEISLNNIEQEQNYPKILSGEHTDNPLATAAPANITIDSDDKSQQITTDAELQLPIAEQLYIIKENPISKLDGESNYTDNPLATAAPANITIDSDDKSQQITTDTELQLPIKDYLDLNSKYLITGNLADEERLQTYNKELDSWLTEE